jgi:hypothetical protein
MIEALPPLQSATLAWLLTPIVSAGRPRPSMADAFAPSWRSTEMARLAADITAAIAGECTLEEVRGGAEGEVRCVLQDRRGRRKELLLTFESADSGRLARLCVRPVLPDSVEVRAPRRDDLPAMEQLELSAPVQREDGTQVVIDHGGKQFDQASVLSDHRWLAAFEDGRMVAVQGVALVTAPIDGVMQRIAYNHYSRSDPQNRQSGNHIGILLTLYRDIFPAIDQFLSMVDVHNTVGLRLSFGQPWPTRVRRLFLPVEALARRRASRSPRRPFDPRHAAALLNATHQGMNLWVPRTADFLTQRQNRAPSVYGPTCWRMTEHAALALWPSGERRTYRKDGEQTVRTLALALDYGFTGESGREELTGLLCHAAEELLGQGISHIAIFVSEGHPPTQWLCDLAEASDTYAVCAPVLEQPAPPAGPVYIDHLIF